MHWQELVAKHCCLTSESVFGIVQMCRIQPHRQCLVTLDLGFNRIGFAGVQNIAKMLEKNTTLTTLGLAGNRIDAAGAEVLSGSLRKNKTLLHLNLFMNDLDIGGVGRFSFGPNVSSFGQDIHVPPFPLFDDDHVISFVLLVGVQACAISEYLQDTKSLLSLNIRSNHMYVHRCLSVCVLQQTFVCLCCGGSS